MDLLNVVLVLAAIGVILWLIQTYVPMAPPINRILTAVVVTAVIIWLLSLFLPASALHTLRVGR